MFDIGWLELLVIGIVALVVVGPKDLPGMFRTAGRFMGKARGMAREFQRSMEAAADESGLKEAAETVKSVDATVHGDAKTAFEKYSANFKTQKDQKAEAAKAAAAKTADAGVKTAEAGAKTAKAGAKTAKAGAAKAKKAVKKAAAEAPKDPMSKAVEAAKGAAKDAAPE